MTAPVYFGVSPIEGIDVQVVYTMTASLTPETPAPPFVVGTEIIGNGGAQYVFVQASTSISPNDFVAIGPAFLANSLTNTNVATAGVRIGLAPGSTSGNGGTNPTMAAGTYFWAAINGSGLKGNGLTTAVANVQLFTGATAGVVTSVTTSSTLAGALGGIIMTASATANPQTFALTWPRTFILFSSAVGTASLGLNNP